MESEILLSDSINTRAFRYVALFTSKQIPVFYFILSGSKCFITITGSSIEKQIIIQRNSLPIWFILDSCGAGICIIDRIFIGFLYFVKKMADSALV